MGIVLSASRPDGTMRILLFFLLTVGYLGAVIRWNPEETEEASQG